MGPGGTIYCFSAKRCTSAGSSLYSCQKRSDAHELSTLLGLLFLERPQFAGAEVRLHLFDQRPAGAARRKIGNDLGIPGNLVALGDPCGQFGLLLFGQFLDRVLKFGDIDRRTPNL